MYVHLQQEIGTFMYGCEYSKPRNGVKNLATTSFCDAVWKNVFVNIEKPWCMYMTVLKHSDGYTVTKLSGGGMGGGYFGVTHVRLSVYPSVCVLGVCPDIMFWTAKPFVVKLVTGFEEGEEEGEKEEEEKEEEEQQQQRKRRKMAVKGWGREGGSEGAWMFNASQNKKMTQTSNNNHNKPIHKQKAYKQTQQNTYKQPNIRTIETKIQKQRA